MTQLQLFKNCKIDNINRVSSFTTTEEQNTYYQSLITDGNGRNVDVVNFQRIGDPMNVKLSYDDTINYTYGRIKLADIWYYFSVMELAVVQREVTQIVYRIDPWETARLQMNLKLGRGFVERGTITDGNIKYWLPQSELQPRILNYNPDYLFGYRDPTITQVTDDPIIMMSIHDSQNDEMLVYFIEGMYTWDRDSFRSILIKYGLHGPNGVLNNTGVTLSDVRGVWVCPLSLFNASSSPSDRRLVKSGGAGNNAYKLWDITESVGEIFNASFTLSTPLVNEDTKRRYITDMRGNEIYCPPYGKEVNQIRMYYDVSYTSCKVVCVCTGDSQDKHLFKPDERFTIPCEPIPIMGDAYQEYFARQRQTDIEGRRIAREQQLMHGIASSITSAGTGLVLGGIGGATGAARGGGIMGGFGLVESLVGYGIDKHFGHQQQSMLDNHHKRQKDELSLMGEGYHTARAIMIVTEEWDDYSVNRFNEYIAVNGYAVNHFLTDCSSFYIPGGTLKGDFDIDGDVPESWKGTIRDRFAVGVRIIQ